MHPQEKDTVEKLDALYRQQLTDVHRGALEMLNTKAQDYDNLRPIWQRLPEVRDIALLLKVKADRAMSELTAGKSAEDSLADAIAYGIMALALSRFLRGPAKEPVKVLAPDNAVRTEPTRQVDMPSGVRLGPEVKK